MMTGDAESTRRVKLTSQEILTGGERSVILVAHLPGSVMTTKIQRLIDDVTRKIETGEWPPGTQLPLDRELRAQYIVSQMTIRTAMERLRDLVESAPPPAPLARYR